MERLKEYSHKLNIIVARENIAKRRDERQIRLIRKALKGESALPTEASSQVPEGKSNQVLNKKELELTLSQAIEEISQQFPSGSLGFFNRQDLADVFNQKVGPHVTDGTKLFDLYNMIRNSTGNARDANIRAIITKSVASLIRGGIETVGQLEEKDLSELASTRNVSLKGVLFLKKALVPQERPKE